MNQNQRRTLTSLALVTLGNLLYALTVKLFLLPGGLVTGGTNGLGLITQHLFGVPLTAFVLAFNIVMLLLGWWILGWPFAATTVASSFLYPLFLEILNRLLGDFALTDDLLLNTIFCGFGIGASLGIVIRAGASTGGMDIPPLILQKKFRIPVSAGLYFFDGCILLGQLLFRPVENVLYGVVLMIIYTTVLDKMLLIGSTKTEVKVVSEKSEEIRRAILGQVDRGVTLLHGEGGYLQRETEVILSIVSNRELPKVERLINDIDPESFMIVSRVTEVRGRGFSRSKHSIAK